MPLTRHARMLVALVGLVALLGACSSPATNAGWRDPTGRGGGAAVPTTGGGGAVPTTGGSGAPGPFAGRVPVFPAAPVPVPIKLPTGPYAPIYHRLPVNQPVAFLTMDDGQVRRPEDIALMQAAHIPFTMFLIAPVAASDPPFFKQLEAAGGVVEDHTITHPIMRGRPYAFQRQEICGPVPVLQRTFGRQPQFFRPPYGDYDQTTLKAAHDCGMKAVFHWSETVNDGKVFYQTSLHRIQPGDIILMHFRPRFVADVLAALTAIHDAGLTPVLLENYLA